MALFGGYDAGPAVRALGQGLNIATGDVQQGINALNTNYAAALKPWQSVFDTGTTGVNQYGSALGLGPGGQDAILAQLQATPGYQFNLGQGIQAIDRGGAARGMLTSGNTLGAEQKFGAGLASNTYQDYLKNLSQYFQPFQTGAAGVANVNTGLGNALMGAYGNLGNLNMNAYGAAGQLENAANIANTNAQNSLLSGLITGGLKLASGGFGGGLGSLASTLLGFGGGGSGGGGAFTTGGGAPPGMAYPTFG